jgi:hypothetical protein
VEISKKQHLAAKRMAIDIRDKPRIDMALDWLNHVSNRQKIPL